LQEKQRKLPDFKQREKLKLPLRLKEKDVKPLRSNLEEGVRNIDARRRRD
tara:strand:+ start:536 stop:685 length:150 start_codon:yes stop_codon:yes gene_type:complete